ncbi:hypothetical protein PMAYCL1PPCAC_12443 [Pristionchus mayeri]|uniref:Uncharacterized protein n=1 Tax=Pristionchus mayeri TaxID=1317129 RepID=A0AAN4ZJ80_9BILA|nr:hypothetical protein PMAYCL1PPCAC_12443 [Pristionchus mayeri]
MLDRLDAPLRSSIRKNYFRNEDRHVSFESTRMTSGNNITNNMEKKAKTRQPKPGAERKRNTVAEKEQSKKIKNNEVITKVQEGREEVTTAEELMRTTERKICEIKQITAIRFKDIGMFVSQVPRVEERKHKLRNEWAEIEKKSAILEESKDLDQFEDAIEQHEQLVTRVSNELDKISAQFDLLDESVGDMDELMPLLNNLLLACNIE